MTYGFLKIDWLQFMLTLVRRVDNMARLVRLNEVQYVSEECDIKRLQDEGFTIEELEPVKDDDKSKRSGKKPDKEPDKKPDKEE